MLEPRHYFDLLPCSFTDLFDNVRFVWEVLPRIGEYVQEVVRARRAEGRPLVLGTVEPGAFVEPDTVIVEEGAIVEAGAYVRGPTWIGRDAEIRHGAYLRGKCLIGAGCVVGHASECKNVVMLDHAKAPHFNYVGDSILGSHVNLGAGTKISNVKITPGSVQVSSAGQLYDTGLRKFGAILGDQVQTGCNSVLNPGTLLGPGSLVYPCALCWGAYPRQSLVKVRRETFDVTTLRGGDITEG